MNDRRSSFDSLERLFQAARLAPWPDEPVEMPGPLKTRLLAHWRSAFETGDGIRPLLNLFRRALVCSAVAMLFCIAWSYPDLSLQPDTDEVLANLELRADLAQ